MGIRVIEETPAFELEKDWIPKDSEHFLYSNYLLPWARSLPGSGPILDLAGGSGLESQILKKDGHEVILADVSKSLLTASNFDQKVFANAEHLPFPSESFSGVLLKDVWIFLSPNQRVTILEEIKRILIKGGSIFLFSQMSNFFRLHYIPKGSKYPQKTTDHNWDEFIRSYQNLTTSGDNIFSIEYLSTAGDTKTYAQKVGLRAEVIEEYDFQSPLATENKWVNRAGFIINLQKV